MTADGPWCLIFDACYRYRLHEYIAVAVAAATPRQYGLIKRYLSLSLLQIESKCLSYPPISPSASGIISRLRLGLRCNILFTFLIHIPTLFCLLIIYAFLAVKTFSLDERLYRKIARCHDFRSSISGWISYEAKLLFYWMVASFDTARMMPRYKMKNYLLEPAAARKIIIFTLFRARTLLYMIKVIRVAILDGSVNRMRQTRAAEMPYFIS